MDSFATRTLRDIAQMIRLRGAETVIVGIQPEVAFSLVQLRLNLAGVAKALDLEEGDHRVAGALPQLRENQSFSLHLEP